MRRLDEDWSLVHLFKRRPVSVSKRLAVFSLFSGFKADLCLCFPYCRYTKTFIQDRQKKEFGVFLRIKGEKEVKK
jgi:hypothetical protein